MAKSARASVSKRNKAKLRATVFGPAVDARTERLSAKLQELASQPKPNNQQYNIIEQNATTINMDIDKGPIKNKSIHKGRIQRRHSNRKNRSSIVFRPRQSKAKKSSAKK
ncbi:hypothetical protein EYZ11_009952 [Aspergillus tanneri]|uniref:DUF2423 domain-containing protein n=1 Tax=Aspergillus tanneri TaxID=1220188 RepID=A0A4S3J6S8_9EURO|nr:hypothetical protein EYZ11_009952 [Aspergillus tanneri]